jgi:hypothetical protein
MRRFTGLDLPPAVFHSLEQLLGRLRPTAAAASMMRLITLGSC